MALQLSPIVGGGGGSVTVFPIQYTFTGDGDTFFEVTTSDGRTMQLEQITSGANADIQLLFGGVEYLKFNENSEVFTDVDWYWRDDDKRGIGTGKDYWEVYDSGDGELQWWTTDGDGGGTNTKLLYVADGTDHVRFVKGIGVFDTAPSSTTALNATRAGDCRIQLASTDTGDVVGIDLYEGFGGGSEQAWRVFNDAAAGFAVRDLTGGTSPFKIRPGAPNNTITLEANGYLRIGQSTSAITTETLSDYIEVEDSGGNTIKLAIVS